MNQTFSGIEIDASSNILVTNNTNLATSGTSSGVSIGRSNNITLSNNIITTQQFGIYVFVSENLIFSFNSLNFNFIGLFLQYIINSTIHDNIIAGNTEFGLKFDGIAPRIYVNDTLIEGFIPNNVTDNDFIANNLMYNPPNMSQALDVGKDDINNWNHNYWSNYPNSRISTGYAINRTIGLNQYSFDYEPSLQPNHANQNFVKSVESLMPSSRTTANWYFTPLFFIFPFIFLVILKKRKLN